MKNKLLIFTSLLLFGCTEEKRTYHYTITNNSAVTVEIIPYTQQGDIVLNKKITLINGQSINKKDVNLTPGGCAPDIGRLISDNEYLTKVEFVFSNVKKNVYTRCGFTVNGVVSNCDDIRNIFRAEYNDEQTEVYTITPEDYQNAVDCGGNCNQKNAQPLNQLGGYFFNKTFDCCKIWSQGRDNIKNKYNNPTEIYLEELFNNWSN